MQIYDTPQGTVPNTISLMLGHPDPETLLTTSLRETMQQFITSPYAASALQYGAEQGTHALIDALVEKINREQSLSVQSANVMIVAGSTHAVDMLARLYGNGSVVLVEAPTYADALHVFRDQQIELCAIPMDEEGCIPSAMEQQLLQLQQRGITPRMFYTVPNFHNPTGRTVSTARRHDILALARRYGFLIVEDDVYRDLAFEENVPPSFYTLAQGQQVVSIGSFSKTLAPGLRLGWLLASEEIIQRCVNCGVMQMGGGANPFTAQMIAQYCRTGAWEQHITAIRTRYQMRRDLMLSALERYMPADVIWTHPAGGFFLWLTLPQHVFAQQVKQLALQQGVLVAAGTGFFVHPADGQHHLRLAYSCAALNDIETGIRILAQVIQDISK